MPLPPPVTTTTLPVTCIVTSCFCFLSGQDEVHHRRVVAGRAQQHERMPDHVLETQPPPGVKNHTQAIERATGEHEPDRQLRQPAEHGMIEHHAAPAEGEIKPDRELVEAARPAELE